MHVKNHFYQKSKLYSMIFFISSLFLFYGIIVAYMVYLVVRNPVKTDIVHLAVDPDYTNYIYIPVTMNDSVYKFLFDTGSSINEIDSA